TLMWQPQHHFIATPHRNTLIVINSGSHRSIITCHGSILALSSKVDCLRRSHDLARESPNSLLLLVANSDGARGEVNRRVDNPGALAIASANCFRIKRAARHTRFAPKRKAAFVA